MRTWWIVLATMVALVGCGDSDTKADSDAGVAVDASQTTDASTTADASITADAANAADATADATPSDPDAMTPTEAPVLESTSPPSPANDNAPRVVGTAPPNATVRLYVDSACAGSVLATGTADGSGAFDIQIAVADDSTTVLYAIAQDALTGDSACSSSSLTYVEDSQTPDSPTLDSTTPPSPSFDANPLVEGTAEPGAIVRIYSAGSCTGAGLGEAIAEGDGAFAVAVDVPVNVETNLFATATDAAGNVSVCSSGLGYVHDATSPAAPTLSATTPASPANDNAPTVDGEAEPNAAIAVYDSTGCSGAIVASGVADGTGAFSISVSVLDDTTRTFRATASDAAGNVSSCSTSFLTYREDSTDPDEPAVEGVDPASPANENLPAVTGTAEPFALVAIWSGGCVGSPLATASADGAGDFSVPTPVVDDDTVTLFATAQDAAGNVSACSTTSVDYEEDSTPPDFPVLIATSPSSPSTNTSPSVSGTAEPNAAIELFASADCSGDAIGTGTADGDGAFSIVGVAAVDDTTAFTAIATDSAGNASWCSAAMLYVNDQTPPDPPLLSGTLPVSPANDNAPSVVIATEADASVTLYATSDCTGTAVDTASADGAGDVAIAASVDDDQTTLFSATSTDLAGNTSDCSTAVGYVEDSTPPAAPVVAVATPASPVDDNSPTIAGTAEIDATVELFDSGACLGNSLASGLADNAGDFSIGASVDDNTMTMFYASATDAAGNTSACSSTVVTYAEQSASTIPTVAGVISYDGEATGRIYINITQTCAGCGEQPRFGTSIPGPGPFLIRGVSYSGDAEISAWLDPRDRQAFVSATDPSGSISVTLPGTSVSDADIALVDPTPVAPGATTVTLIPGSDLLSVSWDDVEDGFGNAAADSYAVYLSDSPSPGPGNNLATRTVSGDTFATFAPLAAGTYYVAVVASAAGLDGPASADESATVGPLVGGNTVSGTINYDGFAPTGRMFVVAFSESALYFTQIESPDPNAQTYTISNVADGDYDLGAVFDLDDDGTFELTEINSFSRRVAIPITMAGGALSGVDLDIPLGNVSSEVRTEYSTNGVDSSYGLNFIVGPNLEIPVRATLDTASGPVDLPLFYGESPEFRLRENAVSAPAAADAFNLELVLMGDIPENDAAIVTAVLDDVPAPLAPVTSSAGDATPLSPTFSWDPPVTQPAGPFTYGLYVHRAGSGPIWYAWEISSSTTSVAYDFDGTSVESPLLSSTTYNWAIAIVDADGNSGAFETSFDTP